jgi:hypothetical protein
MTANPTDVAKYTQDGVIVRSDPAQGEAVKTLFDAARDESEPPRETFFRYAAQAQVIENIRFDFLSRLAPKQDDIDVDQALGLGSSITVAPYVPRFTVVENPDDPGYVGLVRAYIHRAADDRMAVQIIEAP